MSDPAVIAAKAVQKNWLRLGSITKPCNYVEVGPVTNDITAGVVDNEVVVSVTPLNVVFDEFSFTKNVSPFMSTDNLEIKTEDAIAIFPALDLSIKPKINDLIIRTDVEPNEKWFVVSRSKDPVPAHYELHVRPKL